jgi:hypothetical protein
MWSAEQLFATANQTCNSLLYLAYRICHFKDFISALPARSESSYCISHDRQRLIYLWRGILKLRLLFTGDLVPTANSSKTFWLHTQSACWNLSSAWCGSDAQGGKGVSGSSVAATRAVYTDPSAETPHLMRRIPRFRVIEVLIWYNYPITSTTIPFLYLTPIQEYLYIANVDLEPIDNYFFFSQNSVGYT